MADPRRLPGIDSLLGHDAFSALVAACGREMVKQALRDLQSEWRSRGCAPPWSGDPHAWAGAVAEQLEPLGYRPVFNLTGTVLHTNLGRALLAPDLFDAVRDLATRPMNLEFDLRTGVRGVRDAPVVRRLVLLTGAEAATVVNNNAAALLLVLNTLAHGRPVPVSRGELIEIGGSFRLPEIMERAGCRLLEVGTTNRTHPADFRRALAEHPALLLKVHQSNFHITGFTRAVGTRELAEIARDAGVPLCVDLGSGTLVDLARWGLPHEPTPAEVLRHGADLVTFSGDKLLGGVQAGLIVGRRDLIDALNANPLKRALRPDKVTLALLDRTLALYEEPDTLPMRLPLLRTLTLPIEALQARAERIANRMQQRLPDFRVESAPCQSQIGSGSLPEHTLPSVAVRIGHASHRLVIALGDALRRLPVPIVGRLAGGDLWLDMRGAEPEDQLAAVLEHLEPPR